VDPAPDHHWTPNSYPAGVIATFASDAFVI
jgi:hypothetical protein